MYIYIYIYGEHSISGISGILHSIKCNNDNDHSNNNNDKNNNHHKCIFIYRYILYIYIHIHVYIKDFVESLPQKQNISISRNISKSTSILNRNSQTEGKQEPKGQV